MVADDDLACEDLLIGLPLLQHLGIDSRTMLENNRATLDGTDFSDVETMMHNTSIGRLMLARIQGVRGTQPKTNIDDVHNKPTHAPDRPRVNYNSIRMDDNPFPNPNLIDIIDEMQQPDIQHAVDAMLQTLDNGFPQN